jgi:RimJ/RimL family protein N-acetyltransferase
MSQFFETERLRIRGFEFTDLDAFAELCADPIAMQYMGDGETLDRETVERWIGICHKKYAERGYGTSAIVEKDSGKFIGFCGVIRSPENDYDEIIYGFAQNSWGKGYATEAAAAMLDYVFGISELSEIYATIHAKNEASLKMMAKLKMEYEKTVMEEDGHGTAYYLIRRN